MARRGLMAEISGGPASVGPRQTEVTLDGWCEGGLGQQINDGGGCASMREKEKVESLGTYYVTE